MLDFYYICFKNPNETNSLEYNKINSLRNNCLIESDLFCKCS